MKTSQGYEGRVFDHPGLQEIVAEMRHPTLQASNSRFRGNAQKIGRELASRVKEQEAMYAPQREVTNAGGTTAYLPTDNPVLLCIMRAGLPITLGVLDVFEESPVAFTDAKRVEGTYDITDGGIEINIQYLTFPSTVPSLQEKILVIPDIMLATGRSLTKAWEYLTAAHGNPGKTVIITTIAAKPGIEYVLEHVPQSRIYTAVIDSSLDHRGYILPGLGDAGDLSFNGGKRGL